MQYTGISKVAIASTFQMLGIAASRENLLQIVEMQDVCLPVLNKVKD